MSQLPAPPIYNKKGGEKMRGFGVGGREESGSSKALEVRSLNTFELMSLRLKTFRKRKQISRRLLRF